MREKLENLQAEVSKKASELATWKTFMEHPGWVLFRRWLEEQKTARHAVLLEPSTSMGNILQTEFMKGEAAGLAKAMFLPDAQLEMLQVEVKRLNTYLEMEEANVSEQERSTDESSGRVDNERDWFGSGDAIGFAFKPSAK